MLIIPAIDLINGMCVRLTKGNFSSKKAYFSNPVSVARQFEKEGAQMLHVVDLDGAKTGKACNMKLILKMCSAVKTPIQVGGGIRTLKTAVRYLERGIDRIILGTRAVEDSSLLRVLLERYGSRRIIVALDVYKNSLATEGWLKIKNESALSLARKLRRLGVRRVIVTDISKDGTLTKPNFKLMQKIQNCGLEVVASGGISDTQSIKKLAKMGLKGAIIGKALYEKRITLDSALKAARPISNLAKRIIPCLDVAGGRVVKVVRFKNLKDAGDPVKLGKKYAREGADELVFLDIAASQENRKTMYEMVRRVAENIFIPFTVGGGITSIEEIRAVLQAGADKISLNTAAVLRPQLITEAARAFGSQCIVVAVDIKKSGNKHFVYIKGGSQKTDLKAAAWAKQAEKLGAGEILLTSMDRDGTGEGYDLPIIKTISQAARIPVIASGGAGSLEDLEAAFTEGKADAVLSASIFHYGKFSIPQAKKYLYSYNIPIRL